MGFFMPNFYLKEIIMIKGLAITPPVLGRISIGKIVEKNGKRLPEKDDQFTITSQIQKKMDGSNIHWMNSYVPKHKTKNSEPFQYG
jgi:hypothetical protein